MYKKRGLKLVVVLLMLCLLSSETLYFPTNAATGETITITATGQIVDSFNGVDSLYRPGSNDASDSTYGCHAYVIRYYQMVYGKTVYNLFHAQTPMAYGDTFVKVDAPQPGDICAQIKTSSNHWSIVKSVSGTTVNVIDQNNKWVANGVTYAYKNFAYDASEVVFYRLASVESGVNTNSVTTASGTETTQVVTTTEAVTATTQVSSTMETVVKDMSINTGKTKQITSAYVSSLAEYSASGWSSSNAEIATVSQDGYVTGNKKGTATITGTLQNGQTVSFKLKVQVPAQKLKISNKDVTLPKSYKWQLIATISPANTTDKISYQSSNKKIATVSKKGVVKSKKKRGKTTITVKTSSGKKKKCIVRVY